MAGAALQRLGTQGGRGLAQLASLHACSRAAGWAAPGPWQLHAQNYLLLPRCGRKCCYRCRRGFSNAVHFRLPLLCRCGCWLRPAVLGGRGTRPQGACFRAGACQLGGNGGQPGIQRIRAPCAGARGTAWATGHAGWIRRPATVAWHLALPHQGFCTPAAVQPCLLPLHRNARAQPGLLSWHAPCLLTPALLARPAVVACTRFSDGGPLSTRRLPVQVHKEALGAPEQEGYTCILPRHLAVAKSSGASGGGAVAASVEVQRGYGPAEAHATPAEACQLMTRRSAGAWLIPESDRVAALRVSGAPGGGDCGRRCQRSGGSLRLHAQQHLAADKLMSISWPKPLPPMARSACRLPAARSWRSLALLPPTNPAAANGWEGFVLRGFAPLLASTNRPPVLAVEWNPAAMKAAGWKRPLRLLEW